MPRVLVPVTDTSKAGATLPAETTADVAQGNYVPNDGRTVIWARNSNGASTARTVTITVTGAIDGFAPTPRTVSIPAGATKLLGPYEVVNYSNTLQFTADNSEVRFLAVRMP